MTGESSTLPALKTKVSNPPNTAAKAPIRLRAWCRTPRPPQRLVDRFAHALVGPVDWNSSRRHRASRRRECHRRVDRLSILDRRHVRAVSRMSEDHTTIDLARFPNSGQFLHEKSIRQPEKSISLNSNRVVSSRMGERRAAQDISR